MGTPSIEIRISCDPSGSPFSRTHELPMIVSAASWQISVVLCGRRPRWLCRHLPRPNPTNVVARASDTPPASRPKRGSFRENQPTVFHPFTIRHLVGGEEEAALVGILEYPEIIPIIQENPLLDGPYGAKGMGESPVIPTPPAIANAIFNASGVMIKDLPITSEKLLSSIEASGLGDTSA